MADLLQFELVSPETKLASVLASRIQIPGVMGDFTAMPNHAPYLTTLRPGVVRVETGSETTEYVVTGGFAEISSEAAIILAEVAVPRDSATREMIAELIALSEKSLAEANEDTRLVAAQRLRDAQRLSTELSL
jgi:F-type H+-transporting ATPase subunit epsilon